MKSRCRHQLDLLENNSSVSGTKILCSKQIDLERCICTEVFIDLGFRTEEMSGLLLSHSCKRLPKNSFHSFVCYNEKIVNVVQGALIAFTSLQQSRKKSIFSLY